jgi:hypothetical protein
MAVKFDMRTADDEDSIADIIVRELARQRRPVVLLGGWNDRAAGNLRRSLNALGYKIARAATPLELIRRLEDPALSVKTVVLGPPVGDSGAPEVASFLKDWYPNVRRVLVHTPGALSRRDSSAPVHAVVKRPWTFEQWKDALTARDREPTGYVPGEASGSEDASVVEGASTSTSTDAEMSP